MRLHPVSPHLNLYLYPKELDYEELQPMTDNWKRVENFIRTTNDTFDIPVQFADRPDTSKLVFLSMGSFGSANIELMTRLTRVFGKSHHKFIVSKGPIFESHDMPPNMWGQRFLPQTAVLPLVDLVVTHGGNNTVTENFYFGKPMLVLPLFGDQYDNAQRVEETGLGLRLNPFKCTDDELLNAVDRLLADRALTDRMASIGRRIRESDDKKVVSDLIEKIFI
jgi:UDP:flavonoid glycosyltransferase YjiC (YdhE family)